MSEQNEEIIRQHYIAVKVAQEHVQRVQEHLEEIEQRLGQLQSMLHSVEEFSKESVENIILPVANGIFIKAKKSAEKGFLVNVGANVIVEKDAEDAKQLLQEQEQQLKQYHSQIMHQMMNAEQELEKAQIAAQEIIE